MTARWHQGVEESEQAEEVQEAAELAQGSQKRVWGPSEIVPVAPLNVQGPERFSSMTLGSSGPGEIASGRSE